METYPRRVLVGTLLSEKPPSRARVVAAASLLALAVMSAVYWSARPESFYLAATPEAVFQHHQWWRLFTTMGVHLDLDHLFSNALLFGVLSYLLYGYFGPGVFPGAALVGGALTNAITLPTYPDGVRLIGASGVVYWMSGFWLVMVVRIDRRFTLRARLLRCLGFALVTLVPPSYKPQVSYRTHAVGLLLGIVFGLLYHAARRDTIEAHDRYAIETDDEPAIN